MNYCNAQALCTFDKDITIFSPNYWHRLVGSRHSLYKVKNWNSWRLCPHPGITKWLLFKFDSENSHWNPV